MILAIARKLIYAIRNSAILSKIYVSLLGMAFFPPKWKGMLEPALKMYCPDFYKMNVIKKRKLIKDIAYCMMVHGISPAEYFIYDFEHLSDNGRSEYVGDLIKSILCGKIEDKEIREIFNDKALTYEYFRSYFNRECIVIEKTDDFGAFSEFHDKNDEYMIKAVFESKGKSVYKVVKAKEGKTKEELFEFAISMGKCLLEECISQGEVLKKVHPESINTVRVATTNNNGEVKLLFAELRMGCGDSYVDNAGAGGIVAPIDLTTGVITGVGCRENGERYIYHPDSMVQIVGMKIPEWNSLLELSNQIAKVVPEQKYVGWDLAYSDSGWVLVEGNHRAQMVGYQLCSGHGIRKDIVAAFGVKYSWS